MEKDQAELTPIERAAVLLISLESETPGITNNIFSHMGEEKSKLMLKTIANLGRVGHDMVKSVTEEFFNIAVENKVVFGGEDISSKIMKDAFGASEADFFNMKVNFFEFAQKMTDEELIEKFQQESTQLVTCIFNYLPSERMSSLMSKIELERTKEITQLLIDIDPPHPHLLYELQIHLEDAWLGNQEQQGGSEDVQITKMARALEMVSPGVRDEIFDVLEEQNKNALTKLKQQIFTFNDLVYIPDQDIEAILYEVSDLKTLAIAMKGSEEALVEKINNNISDRVKIMLDEELDSIPDDLERTVLEDAQRDLLKVARNLEKNKKISKLIVKEKPSDEPITHNDLDVGEEENDEE